MTANCKQATPGSSPNQDKKDIMIFKKDNFEILANTTSHCTNYYNSQQYNFNTVITYKKYIIKRTIT